MGRPVLVIGAGISGMQSALLLADAGHKVWLLDEAPGIGGSMHLLDRTFPTDSCGICLMLPGRAAYCPTIECDLHRNISILAYAELVDLEGEPGDFTATIRHKPRYVNEDLCTCCRLCVGACPVERPDQYEGVLDEGKAIYRPPTRAVPSAYVIDMDYCTRCGECVEVCPTDAIDLEMTERQAQIGVGAVVLSPGYEPFDASVKGEYGFGHYDNVLSSVQFERMVSLSGSTQADIVRPSDGKTPRRVAFIQCVGSRDESIGRGYCSSVCCTYTAKQVQVAMGIQPDLDVTVFFMDIRAHGKSMDEYFNEVEALPGVTYRRAMVSSVHQYQRTRDLQLSYVAEDGTIQEDDFDMVVLSVGFEPPESFRALGQALSIDLNRYGFCVTDPYDPSQSSRPGVLVGGAFREPKDIPETVVEASAAAASAARFAAHGKPIGISSNRKGPGREERDVTYERPCVGVFLCDCRGGIGSVIDLRLLAERTRELRDVALVQTMDNACLASGRGQIVQAVEEHELNRVVVAGCPARLYQAEFERMMGEVGLNPGLLGRVNLRGEVAWVHQGNGKGAMAKAKKLVEMAVADVRLHQTLEPALEEVSQRVLVIGGGLAGMVAAMSLAEMGHEVDLVERSEQLGGQLRESRYALRGAGGQRSIREERKGAGSRKRGSELMWSDPQAFLRRLVERTESEERIRIYREAEVGEVSGRVGRYQTTLMLANEEEKRTLRHGAIIVATGGREVTPTEYLYGENPRVVTQRELERMLDVGEEMPSNVVMIQCVGSREPERPYCSRVCCTRAVTNALKIKERGPETNVFVLFREMRTYGFREDYYLEARSRGVTFLRYELPDKPRIQADTSVPLRAGDEGLTMRLREPITGEDVEIRAGLLVLSTGIEPYEESNQALAGKLGVSLDKDGFFQEEYPKMRPLDFTKRGIFMCGLAHSPRFADETILQAQGAAMRAVSLLARPTVETTPVVASVNQKRCSACGLCVEVCPYDARVLEPGWPYAEVIEVLCQGCGVCAVACPNRASEQRSFEARRMYGVLDAVT
ncbi:MAG: FAD-dependent oxidoreductase [Anaerolineae bacterium]